MERMDDGKGEDDELEGVTGEDENGVRAVNGEDGSREAMAGYAVTTVGSHGIVAADMTTRRLDACCVVEQR